ncbi:LysR family transcriptional regulator [Bordetella ansorpii]|uniref:LysR family transcriptional regulator n=1 Tax=Bordetella ansorpii TaxID=288768 RepID=A0A157SWL5_9BORD|nr:LysR family transcriptional regulator [Bordetella ansorpii]SAI74860.1 LysR family transcriptional regulator [Bordetella ansorpii]
MDALDEPRDEDGSAARPLNLRQLEVFRAIMMSGSISAAGRALHVSQPALSRVLALTESRLGYPLFERVRGRLAPTPEARRLFAEVEQVYGGIQRVNDLAANLGRKGAGMLRVVTSASYGQRLVPQALARLLARNPRARVDFRSATYDELVGYFLTGQADLSISMSPPDHPSLDSEKLGEHALVCIVPPDHPLAEHDVIRPQDFTSSAWIGYPPGTPLGTALRSFFGSEPVMPAAIEVHSPVSALACVQQGIGPAMVDSTSLAKMPAEVTVRPIEPALSAPVWATQSNLTPLPLLGRRFLDALRAVLAKPA